MKSYFVLICCLIAAGCQTDGPGHRLTDRDTLLCPAIDLKSFPLRGNEAKRLWVTTTNYSKGRLESWEPSASPPVYARPISIHSDAVIRSHPRRRVTFVLNRFGGDNFMLVDERTMSPVAIDGQVVQCSVGHGSNLRDLVVAPDDTIFVSRQSAQELLRIDLSKARIVARVAMPETAEDDDRIGEINSLAIYGGTLFVALQHLASTSDFKPRGPSQVAAVSISDNTVSSVITLSSQNPEATWQMTDDGLVIAGSGVIGGTASPVLDGLIEKRYFPDLVRSRVLVTETELGGDIVAFAMLDDRRGVALVTKPYSVLVEFDALTGKKVRDILASDQYSYPSLYWDNDMLYLGDTATGSSASPSVRVFDGRSLTELPGRRAELLWPPYDIRAH